MSATAAAPGPATVAPVVRAHARYSRAAATGLVFVALAPLLTLAVALATGMAIGEEGTFLAAAIVVPLGAAALAWRFGTWSKILAIVVALLAAGGLFWVAFGLAFPASFGDFVPAVSFVVGFVLTIGGAGAAIVQRRRGNVATELTTGERRVMTGATAVVAVAAVVSGLLGFLGGSAAAGVSGTRVSMSDFAFSETSYAVPAGEQATLVVHNSDGFTHDIVIPDLGVEKTTVQPGADQVVTIPAAEAGTYTVYCSLHSDLSNPDPAQAGMATALVVE